MPPAGPISYSLNMQEESRFWLFLRVAYSMACLQLTSATKTAAGHCPVKKLKFIFFFLPLSNKYQFKPPLHKKENRQIQPRSSAVVLLAGFGQEPWHLQDYKESAWVAHVSLLKLPFKNKYTHEWKITWMIFHFPSND